MGSAGTQSIAALAWRRLLTEPRRPEAIRNSARAHWYVVATVCLGAFMGQLDASIVTVALPHIGNSLHARATVAQWVSLSYMLVLLCTLIWVGRIADGLGRKLLYTWGFAVFTASSLLCGLAPSLPLLIGARILQGFGAAMLQANSVALIREAMPGRLLTRAIGVQGSAQALGLALGPAAGGLLVALGGWRLIFFVNVPVGIVALALSRLLLPRSRIARRDAGEGEDEGSKGILDLLRSPQVSLGLAGGLVSFLAMFGALLVIPYYLLARGVGPTASGLELASLPVTLGVVAPLAGRSAGRLGSKRLTCGGLLLLSAGLVAVGLSAGAGTLLPGLVFCGAGIGAFTPVNNAAVMAAGPRSRAGLLGGTLNMSRTAGAILGVAIASLLYSEAAGERTSTHSISAAAAGHGMLVTLLALAALTAAAGLMLLKRLPSAPLEPR